jgi:cellobiose phosphorylase
MALEYYRKITPAYLEDRTGILGAEPYVYSQMIAGPEAPRAGEAKNSWLTGAAAWALVAATQRLFGVRPDYDGLVVDPCLPDRSGEYVVRRVLRGAEYRIHIHGGGPRSGLRVRVGGNLIRGNVVPYAPAGSRVEIDCDWPETP